MCISYSFEACHHGRPGGARYKTRFLTLGYKLVFYFSYRIDILLHFIQYESDTLNDQICTEMFEIKLKI